MNDLIDVPEIAFVRVLTAGGPYRRGDILSMAFVKPDVGRIVSHDAGAQPIEATSQARGLPETISVRVIRSAGAYRDDDALTLSFLDPAIARIHAVDVTGAHGPEAPNGVAQIATVHVTARDPLPSGGSGVLLTLSWGAERARRFIGVTDKLFTVDRLGWYRHALVMRLLVPDSVICGDSEINAAATLHLQALRSAALETLGRPLLAAFMPAFTITSDWLDAIDDVASARALAGLSTCLTTYATDDPLEGVPQPSNTIGTVTAQELTSAPRSSIEAMLPLLIAPKSAFNDLTAALVAYRHSLIELFGQIAGSSETIRLGVMAQPNHVLDDRLWQLVGIVSEHFAGANDT